MKTNLKLLVIVGLVFAVTGLNPDARGDSVVQFMTAKSLPDATVAVIDPESGTSGGTSGADVNIAVGDIILFKFSVVGAPASAVVGIQSYLTEYIPPGTELVGARITDANGNTVEPRRAGLALNGCGGGSTCNSFNAVPCATGNCNFNTTPGTGSIAQVYADTGVFVTTDPLNGPTPANQFLTLDNGIAMNGNLEPTDISPEVVQLLNDTSAPYNAHNDWDWDQVQAYGAPNSVVSDGDGNTPFGYGSPVAGPNTYYSKEATDTGTRIELDGVTGPWDRIKYPGSQIGTGTASLGSTTVMTRVGADTTTGIDVTPATPVDATAVRWALGETYAGEARFVEVALRVTQVPIDPTFGTTGGNVDCGEVFGSDIASKAANTGDKTNPWASFIGHPQCVFLRTKLDLTVDKILATGSSTLAYTLKGKNLSVADETNARVRLKYVGSDQSFINSSPPPSSTFSCPGETNKTCLEYTLGTLSPSEEFTITLNMQVGGVGGGTDVMVAQYLSNELTAIDPLGYQTTALTVVQPVARPVIVVDNALSETASFAAANTSTWTVQGTVSNAGTTNWTSENYTVTLPTNWRLANSRITIAGTNFTCNPACTATNVAIVPAAAAYASTQSRTISFQVTVPAGTANGIYPIDIATRGSQGTFGSFETNFHVADYVNVGAVRTAKPTLDCPIGSTAVAISGTSENDAGIKVLFNLLQRGTGTATGAGIWSVTNYLPGFGELYGGLEVTATATAPGKLESERSDACFVTTVKQCSDGIDNDGDTLIDFPADPGCTSPGDNNSETDPPLPQCRDGLDNNGAGGIDWPADPSCTDPNDNTENGVAACSDGIDNDGDGQTDFPNDGDCSGPTDGTEVFYAQCQDGLDNDLPPDGVRDFPADPGCHSLFDNDEFDSGSSTLDTKARLLLAVDSSGSMNMNTCGDVFTGGDGTTECPGSDVTCAACGSGTCANTIPDDSRIYQVTAGLSNVVAAFGEVEYSLMRFHQQARSFSCPTSSAGLQSGGWQGGGITPCNGGFNAGDLLVSFAQDNEPTILTWMNHDSDYAGVAPTGTDWEIRGSGTTPLAGILTSANTYMDTTRDADLKRDCRPYRVILVTDGNETCGGSPSAAAATLLANGIPVYAIGFALTDPGAIATLNGIAAAGGTTSAILVSDEAALSNAIADIISDSIVFETCNEADDDCDTLVDEDFPDKGDACDNGQEGECFRTGTMVCAANHQNTECNAPTVVPGTETCNGLDDDCDGFVDENLGAGCTCNPAPEICNGRDDDCDSNIDEGTLPGVGGSCGTTTGLCEPGSIQCIGGSLSCEGEQGPFVETCNLLDDDCDTLVDEISVSCYEFPSGCDVVTGQCDGICQTGLQVCDGTALGECVGDVGPLTEVCNGIDDDCDGTPDDGLGLGTACDNGLDGACFATGVLVCDASGGVVCTAPILPPGTEVCNGSDDDCDTLTDEAGDLGPPIGQVCGAGACGAGTFQCVAGEVECVGGGGGFPNEVCNGFDDDCDGTIDEDYQPPVNPNECQPQGETHGDTGACEWGSWICTGGQEVCDGYLGPTQEIPCNGIDEDCDGNDDQTCPGTQACIDDACRNPCLNTEFPCPLGFFCETQPDSSRYCVPDPCADITCPPGFECDRDLQPQPGCVDLCDNINCPTGTECVNGLCQDCFALGCPDGEVCVRNQTTDLGECMPATCSDITCDPSEFCREGECVPEGCDPDCDENEICLEGECIADPCHGNCIAGEICNPDTGECQVDACHDVNCLDGETCNPWDGDCIPDPCLQIECNAPFECTVMPDGSGTCFNPPPPPKDVVTAAGGGGCSTGGSSSGAGALVLLAAAAALARRRRV